ncbi:cytochrome c oxidase assembly factor Coa1 family protein [Dokdonia sp. Hel_I_53]|uniref:cytochrome c oxidase assembly factor Coa1 family protein n=1 Tax=Dokdonia sp. Hel_I_53 TaxID=1566287 RepID=UPI00119C0BD8|nr:cytochrome c oxidase assembly factor Coa1 family protein [Dokdonia sp. Hel_I_53]TVZ52426.1 cytochrome oxidase complex assembly protein 1 [Dokdonia sp. Hel_I_53]
MNTTELRPSWWKRNWKWALPTGGCLTIIIIVLSFVGYGVYKVSSTMSEKTNVFAFMEVMLEVQKNKEIATALGKPINIDDSDYDPEENPNLMDIDMRLRGKKSNGTLKVKAAKKDDDWNYELFTITVDETGEIIDITDKMNN